MNSLNAPLTIVPFRAELAPDFARLNIEWIEHYFTLEAPDRLALDTPYESIIAPGGEIFFAVRGDRVLGTIAAVPHSDTVIELAKMAVSPAAQRQGIGRLLVTTMIDFARSRGATQVMLRSNAKLAPALQLYRAFGFRDAPMPDDAGYERADVYMTLDLT